MNNYCRWIAFCALLLSMMPVRAQDKPGDHENVTTPTSVLALLPDAGKDSASEFWAIEQYVTQNGQAYRSYFYWSMRRTDEEIVFETRAGDAAGHHHDRLTYSTKGELLSYQFIEWQGKRGRTIVGVAQGEQWVATEAQVDLDHRVNRDTDIDRDPLEKMAKDLPIHWAPLVFAYHLRKGSLSYPWKWTTLTSGKQLIKGDLAIEDIGTEVVAYQGDKVEAYVLLVYAGKQGTDIKDRSNRFAAHLVVKLLPDASLYSIAGTTSGGQNKYTAHRASAQAVAEEFKLDLESTPALPALPDAE